MMHAITFPNLNLKFNINRVAFSLLNKNIYWYSLIILFGISICIFLIRMDKEKYGIRFNDIIDFLPIGIISGLICARLYYVIFKWDYYSNNFLDIFKIWNGGIAIYGGIIGGIVSLFIFCKKRNINFLKFCDYLAPYLALTQSIGRWGNFVNQEAYGSITNSFLKMGILDTYKNMYIYVHPTFLYESFFTFLIFIFLYIKRERKKEDGEIFYLYMIFYGIVRAIIEGFRADSLYLYNIRISQVLAIIFAVIFYVLLLKLKNKNKNIKDS